MYKSSSVTIVKRRAEPPNQNARMWVCMCSAFIFFFAFIILLFENIYFCFSLYSKKQYKGHLQTRKGGKNSLRAQKSHLYKIR